VTDVFLYGGEPNPNDVKLTDPTQPSGSSITGSGALVCGAAAILGIALSISTGTGSLSAQAATVAGEGTVSSAAVVTGEGTLVAQAATLSGVGISASTGTGSVVSQSAAVSGVGIGSSSGTGLLVSQAATLPGVGSVYWLARSGLYLNEDGVLHYLLEDGAGRYELENVRIVAGAAQISGEGEVIGSLVLYGSKLRKAAQEQRYIYRRLELEQIVPAKAAEAIERVLEHYEETPHADTAGAARLLALELGEQGLDPLAAYNDALNHELGKLKAQRQEEDDAAIAAVLAALI
jgi:hypothetical protein